MRQRPRCYLGAPSASAGTAAHRRAFAETRAADHAQPLTALAQANRIRSERARLKAALRAGEERLAPLLLNPPPCLQSASVAEVLLAVPGIGEVKVRRLLLSCRVSPGRRFDGLSARQREDMATLGERG
jgi:hypothetical protein